MGEGLSLPVAAGGEEASRIRRFETRDIVRRLGVLAPDRVFINNYPIRNPAAVFNPSVLLEDDFLRVYARIIVGYYLYASAIVSIRIPVYDVLEGDVGANHYASEIIISPSTRYDMWGAEDPRIYRLMGEWFITYTGRTINFFNPAVRRERTLLITARRVKPLDTVEMWSKSVVHVLPEELRGRVISDKDGFISSVNDMLWVFHRPHLMDEYFPLLVSRMPDGGKLLGEELVEVNVEEPVLVMGEAPFEIKIGWSTPEIELSRNRVLTLIHGIDRYTEAYRVFAAELELGKEGVAVNSVTPYYIMEPRMRYELYGDRPNVIFPTGIAKLSGDEYLITYGATDFLSGFGVFRLSDLTHLLDKGRIY